MMKKIPDYGIPRYSLFVQYKKENHVLFAGTFPAFSWAMSVVEAYGIDELTWTMVEI